MNQKEEHYIDYQTISLCFGNALSYLLKDGEGIIAQGEDSSYIMHKFLIYRYDKKIRISSADKIDKPVGTKFWIHNTKEDAIIAAAINGEEFIID